MLSGNNFRFESPIKTFSFKSGYFSEQDNGEVQCQCPHGFKGDGVKSCEGKRNYRLGVSCWFSALL